MLEIEPYDALALSLYHSPGTCALLVGSGLSTAAGIPTGWDITLDLIRQVGTLAGVAEHDNWEAWFTEKYGQPPSYSEVLGALASTQSERQAVLRSYIEPKEGEDARRPTKAHHAIAAMVVAGAVRVILTTNFDRLIETALREAGIEPVVISSTDALAGATPLVHARCTVIKLNGDYLDTRIKNTDAELASYDPEIDALLDEVFDRFGLLVVGWSGIWDKALRDALMRVPTRRYPFYWAARGAIEPEAQDIITHRGGRSFPIADANSFFSRLSDTVEALRQAARPHPNSVAVAVALAKRYCRDDRYALEWVELLQVEVGKIRDFVAGPDYPCVTPTPDNVEGAVVALLSRSEVLRRICLISGRWGTKLANDAVASAIGSLGFGSILPGYNIWFDLRDLCASVCFYWAVAGAAARPDYVTIYALMHSKINRSGEDEKLVRGLPLASLSDDWNRMTERRKPASRIVFDVFKNEVSDAVIDTKSAPVVFDNVEALIALEYGYLRSQDVRTAGHFWAPIGLRAGRSGFRRQLSEYESLSADLGVLGAGLVGGTSASGKLVFDKLQELVRT